MQIFTPLTGYKKFHLCIAVGSEDQAEKFLFLNSEDCYMDTYSVPCSRVPCLPASDTGVTAFSFSMIPRYSFQQLKLYRAQKLGCIEKDVAFELLQFAQTIKSLGRRDKELVKSALAVLI